MRRGLVALVVACTVTGPLAAAPIPPGSSCIPYGSDWAFMMSAPPGWEGECNAEKSTGAVVVYWPVGGQWATAASVLYVSVYKKNGESLAQVIEHDLVAFKERNPEGVISDGQPVKTSDGALLPVKMTSGLRRGRFEAIAYADQPTVVLIIGLTSKTSEDREAAMPAFQALIESYVRIDKVEFKNAEHGPT